MVVAAPQERLFVTTQLRWTLLCGATIAEVMLLVLPSFVGALTDELRLSSVQVGLLGSADMLGTALVGASGPFWVRRVSWKRGVRLPAGPLAVQCRLLLGARFCIP